MELWENDCAALYLKANKHYKTIGTDEKMTSTGTTVTRVTLPQRNAVTRVTCDSRYQLSVAEAFS